MRRRNAAITIATLWDTAWKGYAILRAARRGDYRWIVPLLIVNSVGILPMLYIFVFSKRGSGEEVASG